MARPAVPIEQRFWARTQMSETCWLWLGRLNKDGYGSIGQRINGRDVTTYVHRFAYVLLVDSIPPGYEVDHTCLVRHCVNPAHLEAVTREENMRRIQRVGQAARGNARPRAVCGRGLHEMSGANVLTEGGRRRCRACKNERQRREYRDGLHHTSAQAAGGTTRTGLLVNP